MESARITNFDSIKKAKMYTGHEALLLNYESALTRKDQISGKYYGCSGHLLWVGERTRDLDGAHVEYLRGIENPVGIKISHKFDENENIENDDDDMQSNLFKMQINRLSQCFNYMMRIMPIASYQYINCK